MLDLEEPYSRSLLRMLYKTCERFHLSHEQCFKDITAKGFSGSYSHPEKDDRGVWVVPTKGKLTLTFTIERAVDGALKDVHEDDFAEYLEKIHRLMRFTPAFKKVVPMFAQWRKLVGSKQDQQVMIDALAKDFEINYPQLQNLCSVSRELAPDTIAKLLHCMVGSPGVMYLSASMTPHLGGFIRLIKRAHALFIFNAQNPTDHYRLDLENSADYAVAESLMLIDRWEVGVALKRERVDTSQRGNRSQVRNERFNGKPVEVASLAEWTLPTYDELEFDYCSNLRAPTDAQVLDKVTMSNIMVSMQQAEIPSDMMIECLRKVSHEVYLKSTQVRELLGLFKEKAVRLRVFVMYFNRMTDMWNEKVFRVRFEDGEEFRSLCERVGFCTYFPFMQPEQCPVELNFKYYDQRLAAHCFILLANKERRENVCDFSMTNPDGTIDPLPLGLPRSWEVFDRMPKAGVFRANYKCSPEDRKFQVRKSLLETYGFWNVPVQEHEVMWWADINQTPDDVLEFLTFVCRRFPKGVKSCFKFIDGEDGNGVISLREFEEGIQEMGFQKFKEKKKPKKATTGDAAGEPPRPTEKDRIRTVFRYLDPSGEGGVSVDEFFVLELLWSEVNLCIREFVQFLDRTIGDDLDEAWEFFDEDGSGEIDKEEWQEICEKLSYFGPVMPIFRFLDQDGEGSISADEFAELEQFQDHGH